MLMDAAKLLLRLSLLGLGEKVATERTTISIKGDDCQLLVTTQSVHLSSKDDHDESKSNTISRPWQGQPQRRRSAATTPSYLFKFIHEFYSLV